MAVGTGLTRSVPVRPSAYPRFRTCGVKLRVSKPLHIGFRNEEANASGSSRGDAIEVNTRPDSPPRERKVKGRGYRGPTANAVLTTVVDAWGRSWTPRCPSRSSGLIRRTAVDSRGRGHSPENRMVTSRWSPFSRRYGPAASRSAAATRLD